MGFKLWLKMGSTGYRLTDSAIPWDSQDTVSMLYLKFGPPYAALCHDNLQVNANPPAYRYEKEISDTTRNQRFCRLRFSRNNN